MKIDRINRKELRRYRLKRKAQDKISKTNRKKNRRSYNDTGIQKRNTKRN